MKRRRGPRRAEAQGRSAGGSIRQARRIAGLTRHDASVRAGVAPSTWQRIEAGSPSVTLENFVAAADAVGLDFVCQTFPGRPPGLRDSGQLAVARHLRWLAHDSWRVTFEERAGDHGEAIDLVLSGATEMIAIEVERLILDWQAQLRRWLLKRDWLAARYSLPVRLVVVVADSGRNRAALSPFGSVVGTSFPAGTRAVMTAIRTGRPLSTDGIAWLRLPPRGRQLGTRMPSV